jgi:hypothetical protein
MSAAWDHFALLHHAGSEEARDTKIDGKHYIKLLCRFLEQEKNAHQLREGKFMFSINPPCLEYLERKLWNKFDVEADADGGVLRYADARADYASSDDRVSAS